MANRHQSRKTALEVLYAWHSGGKDAGALPGLLADRLHLPDRRGQDIAYAREAVHGVIEQVEQIDALLAEVVRGRSLRSVAHVELSILRLAVWELLNRLEIPYRVIINEALMLAREYAGEAPRGFINGVLDKLARRIRPEETSAA